MGGVHALNLSLTHALAALAARSNGVRVSSRPASTARPAPDDDDPSPPSTTALARVTTARRADAGHEIARDGVRAFARVVVVAAASRRRPDEHARAARVHAAVVTVAVVASVIARARRYRARASISPVRLVRASFFSPRASFFSPRDDDDARSASGARGNAHGIVRFALLVRNDNNIHRRRRRRLRLGSFVEDSFEDSALDRTGLFKTVIVREERLVARTETPRRRVVSFPALNDVREIAIARARRLVKVVVAEIVGDARGDGASRRVGVERRVSRSHGDGEEPLAMILDERSTLFVLWIKRTVPVEMILIARVAFFAPRARASPVVGLTTRSSAGADRSSRTGTESHAALDVHTAHRVVVVQRSSADEEDTTVA